MGDPVFGGGTGYGRSVAASPPAAGRSSAERVARRRHRNRPSPRPAVPAHISAPRHGDDRSARHPDSLVPSKGSSLTLGDVQVRACRRKGDAGGVDM